MKNTPFSGAHYPEKWVKYIELMVEGYTLPKIAVVVAQDRNGNIIARKAGTGRVKADEIDNVIGEYIHPSSLLCTDTATDYKKFARIKGLQHETVNERIARGTRYLDNYLCWFRWLELGKKFSIR